jgi:hypothetical protein
MYCCAAGPAYSTHASQHGLHHPAHHQRQHTPKLAILAACPCIADSCAQSGRGSRLLFQSRTRLHRLPAHHEVFYCVAPQGPPSSWCPVWYSCPQTAPAMRPVASPTALLQAATWGTICPPCIAWLQVQQPAGLGQPNHGTDVHACWVQPSIKVWHSNPWLWPTPSAHCLHPAGCSSLAARTQPGHSAMA